MIVDWRTHGGGIAAQRIWPRPAEVDLPDHGGADGRRDGRHLRAAVRPAVGASDPVAAGFLGAALALGWTVSEIVSAIAGQPTHDRAGDRHRAGGDSVGSGTGRASPSAVTRPCRPSQLWALALLIAGIGIGMTWPHLTVRAMNTVNDPAESRRGGRGDQHRAAGLRGVRRRAGRCRGQHRPGRPGAAGPLALRGIHGVGRRQRYRLISGDPWRPHTSH